MKIERNDLCNYEIPITNIADGECFIYNEKLHMKVGAGAIDYKDMDKFPFIIVNLEDNKLNSLKDWVKVIRINAKIVVE